MLAKTRPRHHSGPVRDAVLGTARVRKTTALGGAEPIAGTVRAPVRPGGNPGSGACGKESGRCPLTLRTVRGRPPRIAGRVRGHEGSEVYERKKSVENKDGSAF